MAVCEPLILVNTINPASQPTRIPPGKVIFGLETIQKSSSLDLKTDFKMFQVHVLDLNVLKLLSHSLLLDLNVPIWRSHRISLDRKVHIEV